MARGRAQNGRNAALAPGRARTGEVFARVARAPSGNAKKILLQVQKQAAAEILSQAGAGEVSLLVPRGNLMIATDILKGAGAITAEEADYVFRNDDPLVAAFAQSLRRHGPLGDIGIVDMGGLPAHRHQRCGCGPRDDRRR